MSEPKDIDRIKSLTLEEPVINAPSEEVARVYKELGKVDFTAGALGLACRYRDLETVETLVECGATFKYDEDFLKNNYLKLFNTHFSGRFPDFANFLVKSLVMVEDLSIRYFIRKLKGKKGQSLALASDGERVKIAQYLCRHIPETGFDSGSLLYYSCLEFAAELGWLKQPKKRDEMIAFAAENGKTECTAYLLDYKNRTADLAAEREKAERKLERELNAAHDSAAVLSRFWSFKKKEDGTIIITGYKGDKTEITVPEKIGGAIVTAIGERAFSPNAPRITEEQAVVRCRITKITVPPSVKVIGAEAFGGSGVCKGNFNAFTLLEEVTLPNSLDVFADKTSAENAPIIFVNCKRLTVKIPHSPYAEIFCRKNKVNYVFKEENNNG